MVRYRVYLEFMGAGSPDALVSELYNKNGDFIQKDQSVMELETDKATLDVPCPFEGEIKYVAELEQTIEVGGVLFYIDSDIRFQKGDKVQCIDTKVLSKMDIAPPLFLNYEYEIKEVIEDSKGNQHIDVGLESKYNYIRSLETQEELDRGNKIHWCHPSRFIKL